MPENIGPAAGGKKKESRGSYAELRDSAPTLSDLGITKKTSMIAQQLAALPEDTRQERTISEAVRV
jgi:hypothetical protein